MGYKCFDGLARMRQRANINASLADAIVPLEKGGVSDGQLGA